MSHIQGDTYCGLYCGACEIACAYARGQERGEPVKWEELPEKFREHIPKAELKCLGCKTDVLFKGCQSCQIRKCGNAKGVDTCAHCGEYPCALVKNLMAAVSEAGDRLPHTKVVYRNLDLAKEAGVQAWTHDQARRWSCPDCGAGFTWYQETCAKCGRELGTVKDYNSY